MTGDSSTRLRAIFEPWAFGDALIAASAVRIDPSLHLLCHRKWWNILAELIPPSQITPLDLNYPDNTDKWIFFTDIKRRRPCLLNSEGITVHSVRGDIRDVLAARRVLPGAKIRTSGWLRFAARRSALLDFPFRRGNLPVINQYAAWCRILGLAFNRLQEDYASKRRENRSAKVGIHVGARWRSKAYPAIAELAESLNNLGFLVEVLAGPNDTLPAGPLNQPVVRVVGPDIVTRFKEYAVIVANDSAAMHLSAWLGIPTIALCRVSNIHQWLPPAHVTPLYTGDMPHGYRPDKSYNSDIAPPGWPSIDIVVEQVQKSLAEGALRDHQRHPALSYSK